MSNKKFFAVVGLNAIAFACLIFGVAFISNVVDNFTVGNIAISVGSILGAFVFHKIGCEI